jgi:hypothetical protein
MLKQVMRCSDANVAVFNANLLMRVAVQLGIGTRFIVSSAMQKDDRLTGQERVIDICRRLGATQYINPIGGTRLYEPERFDRAGLKLCFLQAMAPAYSQFGQPPVRDLSIIDVMMFNSDDATGQLLQAYQLLELHQASSCPPVQSNGWRPTTHREAG